MRKKTSISIKSVMLICFFFIGMFAAFTSYSIFQLSDLLEDVDQFAKVRYESYLTADELRQSSDDLTRLGRTYVITNDERYEKMYMDILAIRNGDKARPEKLPSNLLGFCNTTQ